MRPLIFALSLTIAVTGPLPSEAQTSRTIAVTFDDLLASRLAGTVIGRRSSS